MKFTIKREALLKPLQQATGVVEKRLNFPILANVLLVLDEGLLSITGTDLEIELLSRVPVEDVKETGETTVPAKKLLDICRNMPEGADITISSEKGKFLVKSGRSRFSLSELAADEFPSIDVSSVETDLSIKNRDLKRVIEATHFAMAQEDVRYFLNGMLWEIGDGYFRGVTADGHRLAMSTCDLAIKPASLTQVIIPRKAITELLRSLGDNEDEVNLTISRHHARIVSPTVTFTTKLIDSKFPDYKKVVPKGGDKVVTVERDKFKEVLSRVAVLSNEKLRSVRLELKNNLIRLFANNLEQEQAEEELNVDYKGEELKIGFNIGYLLDVLSAAPEGSVSLTLSQASGSALIEHTEDKQSLYVVSPMNT